MTLPLPLLPVAALACCLALAPGEALAQAAAAGDSAGVADVLRPTGDGTAGPPPAAGPSPSPSVSGDPATGRIPVQGPTDGRQAPGMPAVVERAAPPAAGAPGRQDIPPTAAPASSSEAPGRSWRDAEIAQAFECPIGPIARMLEAGQVKSEFSPALELEREVLVLCRDRWEVLKGMMDAELALAAALRKDSAARERQAIELEELRQLARARVEGARQGAAEAAREAEARKLAAAEPDEAPARVLGPAPEEVYGWFALKGSGSDLRAGVTDGDGRWWVRVGDVLPGGAAIGAIQARPPRVVVKGGAAAGLPYRPAGR